MSPFLMENLDKRKYRQKSSILFGCFIMETRKWSFFILYLKSCMVCVANEFNMDLFDGMGFNACSQSKLTTFKNICIQVRPRLSLLAISDRI